MEELLDYTIFEYDKLKNFYGVNKEGILKIPTASNCNCNGRCVIQVNIKDGKITHLTTDTDEEHKLGIRSCIRGQNYLHTFLRKDRLLYPLKRIGKRGEGNFQPISWNEAISVIAQQHKRIKSTYGCASRYINYATGYEMCSGVPAYMMRRLLALDGGYLNYYNNYSNTPSAFSTTLMYGNDQSGNSPDTFRFSKLIILWSFNPAETLCGGNMMYYLRQAKENGAKIIVIDPRYSDTAVSLADQWIGIRPTTDCALMDAMAYVIYKEQLHDEHFLYTYCQGFYSSTLPKHINKNESYLSYLMGEQDGIIKTPVWASSITGVSESVIYQLARDYAMTKPAAILEGWGAGRHAYGEQFSRGLITLACMTGNVGIKGGSAAGVGHLSYPCADLPIVPPMIDNPVKDKIPCYKWTDAVKDGKIKMIYNLAGNTLINQHGNCNYTSSLLKDESNVEFIVCSDIFMTSSAKYADILLPGTSMFEEENITSYYTTFYAYFKANKILNPPGKCRFDYEWICDLAKELGLYDKFSESKTYHEWIYEAVSLLKNSEPNFPDYETFCKKGIYKPKHIKSVIAYEDSIHDFLHHPFSTPSHKIEIFSTILKERNDSKEQPPIPKYIPAWEGPEDSLIKIFPLQCIGWHSKARTHSVHNNNEAIQSIIPQFMWINPVDARKRHLQTGDTATVYNDRGTLEIPVLVTDKIIDGVVSIPQGAWYTPNEETVDVGGCINTLTSLKTTKITESNPQHTNLVEVKKSNRHIEYRNTSTPPISKEHPFLYIEPDYCTGCQTCVAACQNLHHTTSILNTCLHCNEPACQAVCPVHAVKKDSYGIVSIDDSLCISCKRCAAACPNFSITLSSNDPLKKTALKCDMCQSLLKKGQEPACVASCPMRILHCRIY